MAPDPVPLQELAIVVCEFEVGGPSGATAYVHGDAATSRPSVPHRTANAGTVVARVLHALTPLLNRPTLSTHATPAADVELRHLVKRFGDHAAVDDVTLSVRSAELLAHFIVPTLRGLAGAGLLLRWSAMRQGDDRIGSLVT